MNHIVILHTDVAPDAGEDELDCLRQADTIAAAMRHLGYRPTLLPFVLDLNATISRLRALQPDIVFNLVETLAGTGSMIYFATALLDFLRIPYTGCRTDAMFLTSNKPLTKQILHTAGIATPAWMTADGKSTGLAENDTFLIKAAWEDASVGLDDESIIHTLNAETLLVALQNRKSKLKAECFAEAYIDGREFNIALLATKQGVQVLPAAEMLFLDYPKDKLKLLDYRAKWVEDSFEYDNTMRTLEISSSDESLVDRLKQIALHCWNLFGLRGYARVDFRVDHNGQPWVLEINANPCLSEDAGFAAALERTSIPYPEAIDAILQDAGRK
jgi:D-alanine-D-alanine ligase